MLPNTSRRWVILSETRQSGAESSLREDLTNKVSPAYACK